MRLSELDGRFHRYERRVEIIRRVVGDPLTLEDGDPVEEYLGAREYLIDVATLAEAQGIMFLCPKCVNSGAAHHCIVSFEGRGVESTQGSHGKDGQPSRWTVSGTSMDDLSTQPSILISYPCGWHGYITNGDAT